MSGSSVPMDLDLDEDQQDSQLAGSQFEVVGNGNGSGSGSGSGWNKAQLPQGPMVGPYLVGAELGEGGFSTVHLGINHETGERVALKILKKKLGRADNQQERSEELQVRREIAAMSKLCHRNILRLVDVNWNAPAISAKLGAGAAKPGSTSVVVVLEFAAGGELFEFLSYTGAFEESIARSYFHQLISAVDFAHQHNIYHRDLKPENLLLDANFTLKLADFGFSNMLGNGAGEAGAPGANLMYTECGTPSYMAPEMFQNRGYDPAMVDVWACGVILFIMLAGFPPFQKPNISDWWFQKLASNRQHLFWQAHSRSCYFSESTKDFLNKILTPDPSKRMTIPQMQKHDWFVHGARLPQEQLQQELARRKRTVNERKMREKQELARQQALRGAGGAGGHLGAEAARDLPMGNPAMGGFVGRVLEQQQQQKKLVVEQQPQQQQVSSSADSEGLSVEDLEDDYFPQMQMHVSFLQMESSVVEHAAPPAAPPAAPAAVEKRQKSKGAPARASASSFSASPAPPAGAAAAPRTLFDMAMQDARAKEPALVPKDYLPYLLGSECYTKFRSQEEPSEIMQRLVQALGQMDCLYSQSREECLVRGNVATLTGPVHLTAQIFRELDSVPAAGGQQQAVYVVEVRRRSGHALAYQSIYNVLFNELADIIMPDEQENQQAEQEEEEDQEPGSVVEDLQKLSVKDKDQEEEEEEDEEPGA